jgi:PleD family two-component response regulator
VAAGGATLTVTVSLGCAALGPSEPAEALVARADARLYEAKRAGRDRVVW